MEPNRDLSNWIYECVYIDEMTKGTILPRVRGKEESIAQLETIKRKYREDAVDYRERITQLEAENEALREHFNAHLAVENGLASMDLHNEAVDRLTKARDALLTGEDDDN